MADKRINETPVDVPVKEPTDSTKQELPFNPSTDDKELEENDS